MRWGKRAAAAIVAMFVVGSAKTSMIEAIEPVRATPPKPEPYGETVRARVRYYRKKQREDRRERHARRALRATRHRLIQRAMTQVGVAYGWAMSWPGRAFDCSGFTMWVAEGIGRVLPHSAEQQDAVLENVPREHLQPGDLVFFSYGRLGSGVADHVELYGGNGQSIGAASGGVEWQPVDWSHFLTGGRFVWLKD